MYSNILLGLLAAIGLGIWLVERDGKGDLGDQIGDALVTLTTSEEHRLSQLESETQAQVRALVQSLKNDGLDIFVGSTLRTQAAEKAAIASGHSAVKTHSWHELGRAADLYPVNPDTAAPDLEGIRDDLFVQMQQRAVELGFHQIAYNDDWSRRYITTSKGKTWDGGHVEWHGPYDTIALAVEAEGAYYGIA